MQTSVRVSKENRDALAAFAAETGAASLDEALRALLWQARAARQIEQLNSDPDALRAYRDEARDWAELDVQVRDVDDEQPW